MVLDRDDDQQLTFENGESYEVEFTVPEGDLADSAQSTNASFTTSEATTSFDQAEWNFESADNQSITGTSTYTSGTEFQVRIESQDSSNPLVERQTATVQADGSWEVQFDLSELPEGTEIEISLSGAGTDSATGQIAAPAAFEVSDLSAPSTAQVGDEVTVTATVTNTGDLEGTTDAEFLFDGDVVSELTQEVTVAGGESTEVTFTIPVEDDVPPGTYTHGVQAGDGSATDEITIEEASTTQPPTTTQSDDPTTTMSDDPTTTQSDDPTTTQSDDPTTTSDDGTTMSDDATTMSDDTTTEEDSSGQPGFTMGVGIVALLAAALLALRRRN
jgi:PGF-CTERM protein